MPILIVTRSVTRSVTRYSVTYLVAYSVKVGNATRYYSSVYPTRYDMLRSISGVIYRQVGPRSISGAPLDEGYTTARYRRIGRTRRRYRYLGLIDDWGPTWLERPDAFARLHCAAYGQWSEDLYERAMPPEDDAKQLEDDAYVTTVKFDSTYSETLDTETIHTVR